MSIDSALSQDDIRKIKHTITEAVKVKQEVKDLNEGLRDVVKHVSEELGINLKDMNKAISIAFKQREHEDALEQEKDSMDTVEEILGYTS